MRTSNQNPPPKQPLTDGNPSANLRELKARQVLDVLAELGSEHLQQRAAYRLTSGTLKRMWTQIVAKTGNGAMGVHLGELFGPMSSAVTMWAWSTGDPRTALELVVSYWRAVSDISKWELVEQDALVGVRYSMLHGVSPVPEDIQLRLTGMLSMLRWMTVPDLRPVRAAFQLREPSDRAEYHRVFNCPITWNHTPSELWFHPHDLVPPEGDTPKLYTMPANFWDQRAVRYPATERSLVEQLEGLVEASLEQGEIGIKFAAPRLGMSERTLIRKLREEGTTYRALVEHVRRDKAVELMLDRQLTLKQIALALGYSNEQNFARAYQRWYGISPGEARDAPLPKPHLL